MANLVAAVKELPLGFFLFAAAVLGAVIGSFLNVVIHRLPREESLLRPGSHCPSCGTPIRAWQNVPILSYILLRGRCAACGAKIPPRYLVVEILAAGAAVVAVWRFGPGLDALGGMLLAWHLIALACIDFETRTLPDHIVLSMGLFGLAVALLREGLPGLVEALLAVLVGLVLLLIVRGVTRLLFPRAPGGGMGGGDLTTTAGFSVYLQALYVPFALVISAFTGLVGAALWSLFSGRSLRGKELPFGPALAVGAWVTYLFGASILRFALDVV